jgi:hypothetical protein
MIRGLASITKPTHIQPKRALNDITMPFMDWLLAQTRHLFFDLVLFTVNAILAVILAVNSVVNHVVGSTRR